MRLRNLILILVGTLFLAPMQALSQRVIVGQKIPPAEADPFADEEIVEAPADETEDSGDTDPLNAQISAHILKLAQKEQEKRYKFMQVVIDDVARLCNLKPAQREQLNLAAKGASQRSMKDWHEQAERYFRTRLDSKDKDSAKETLEGMGNVNFGGNRAEEEGESLELWKDTLGTVLSDEQIAYYEEVLEQRHLDRIEAISRMSLTTLDSHLRLTPTQKDEMAELVNQAAIDYLDDIRRYWGDYFEKGMLMSLANASEDDVLKEILTENQFERLKNETTSYDHFWDTKKRNRRAEKKAAELREQEKEAASESGTPK